MESQSILELKRSRGELAAKLSELCSQMELLLTSYENKDSVRELVHRIDGRFSEFANAHFVLKDALADPTARSEFETQFDSVRKNHLELQDRVNSWFAGEPVEPDVRSCVGTSVSRVSASGVRATEARIKRRLSELRLQQQLAEQELQRTEEELERQKREVEREKTLLRHQNDVAEAAIEENEWAEACDERSLTPSAIGQGNPNMTAPADVTRAIAQGTGSLVNEPNPHVSVPRDGALKPQRPGSAGSGAETDEHVLNQLANVLREGFYLPKPELFSFSGHSLDYSKFINNFEINIEQKVSDNKARLGYLIQYCEGEVKELIEDCVMLGKDGYSRAKELLRSRYGKPHMVAQAYTDMLVNGSPIKANDVKGLLRFSLEMTRAEITLSQLGFTSELNSSESLRKIAGRLPSYIKARWVEKAHKIVEPGRSVVFKDLSQFVNERASVANSMFGLDMANESKQSKGERGRGSIKVKGTDVKTEGSNSRGTTLATAGTHKGVEIRGSDKNLSSSKNESSGTSTPRYCRCCAGACAHLAACSKFKEMKIDERKEFVKRERLCFNCLKWKRVSKDCRKNASCTVTGCDRKHQPLLHSASSAAPREPKHPSVAPERQLAAPVQSSAANVNPSVPTAQPSIVTCLSTKTCPVRKVCMSILPVRIEGTYGKSVTTYALLDSGSDVSLCDENLVAELGLAGKPKSFTLTTLDQRGSSHNGSEVDLKVQSVNGKETVHLKGVWTVTKLPIAARSAPNSGDIKQWKHLADLDIPEINASEVRLLIGSNVPEILCPLEVRRGRPGEPCGLRSILGWTIMGPTCGGVDSGSGANVNFMSRGDNLDQNLERMWTTEFTERTYGAKTAMSREDRQALSIMESSCVVEKGHYKIALPWRDERPELQNNRRLAKVRLEFLRKKFQRDPALFEMYKATMDGYLSNGYAKKVEPGDPEPEILWYLPHHPVVSPHKPGKLRVVFDCAAKYKGVSLNDQLLQGPDLTNSLIGVLMRFREEPIALSADIEAMFHQVKVTEKDTDALRFLWWTDGDLNSEPEEFKMTVHLFGARSSPSCSAYALKRAASDQHETYADDVISTVERNFYVDDLLKSLPTEAKAISLASDIQGLLASRGFRLTKWVSNSKAVLATIPDSEKALSIVSLDLEDNLPSERALGVHWNVETDTLGFKVKIQEKPTTKRGILSIVSSLFDPCGLVAPVTLPARLLVQRLWQNNLGWDDAIPRAEADRWRQWVDELPSLHNIRVNRCLRPKDFIPTRVELHVFCDASELGFGAYAYIRQEDEFKNVCCSLVIGKSRLAPLKQLSIPRLELKAAVVACHLRDIVVEELGIEFESVVFWTDLAIVLGYINNRSRRFKTFVANRISVIQESSSPFQWRHVPTKYNPADLASRGVSPCDSDRINTWVRGPEFLWMPKVQWPINVMTYKVSDDDAELRKEAVVSHVLAGSALDNLLLRYSSWDKLQRAIAWLVRFKKYCCWKFLNRGQVPTSSFTVGEIRRATEAIVLLVQKENYPRELEKLKRSQGLPADSSIMKLNPTVSDGILRVGGRLTYSSIDRAAKHPMILPQKTHVTSIIIRHFNEINGHIGVSHVLSKVRTKFWIVRGTAAVKRAIGGCFDCRRRRRPTGQQQMAPLPHERVTPDRPPFTDVGIDYFGPLYVKRGRGQAKRYGCLFTCLATRAIHLEAAHSLDTDSFLGAIQRFISRRGQPAKATTGPT